MPRRDRADQIGRRADAHQVARLFLGQQRHDAVERRQHDLLPLAHRQAADRVAGKIHGDQLLRRARAQLRVRPTLHDREQRLSGLGYLRERRARALRPAQRQFHGAVDFTALGGKLETLVQLHLDVGAEQALDLDGAFGREHVRRAVEVRLEAHALLADRAQLAERHDLEAARVRQDRALPAHELMQAAKPSDALRARPQHQVIGVGQHDVGAGVAYLLGVEAP